MDLQFLEFPVLLDREKVMVLQDFIFEVIFSGQWEVIMGA